MLRVGFLAGAANEATQQIIAAFGRRRLGWRVEMRAAPWTDPTAGLARPSITYRPVTGVSPSQVGVAWPPAADTSPVIQDFVRCCRDNSPGLG